MSQNPHIIIVDDEAPAREMVGDYLKMHGFTVTLCEGGKSLRTAIEGGVPDLVVLDLNMPEEDGLSIIRDLKRHRPRGRPRTRRRRLHRKALRVARIDGAYPLGAAAERPCQGTGRGP